MDEYFDRVQLERMLRNPTKHNRFQKCRNKLERINSFLLNDMQYHIEPLLPKKEDIKSDEKATAIREKGNDLYKGKKYFEALNSYTLSLALAKTKAIACKAFSNRSAALLKLGFIRESLEDIDRALKCCDEDTQSKLLSRKEEAMKRAANSENNITLNTSQDSFVSDRIKVQKTTKYGRHIVATEEIPIGEVLLIEKPLAAVLCGDYLIYCHECCTVCYNLVPCDFCSSALFCSESCKTESYSYFHKYECCFFNGLNKKFSLRNQLNLALKTTIKFLKLRAERKFVEIEKINKLATHEDLRSVNDTFIMSWFAAVAFYLLQKNTSFFQEYPGCEDIFKEYYFDTLCRIDLNSAGISRLEIHSSDYKPVIYARAIYLLYSMFNHSCVPNCFFYHDGKNIYVRSVATIKKGEQCFISYRWTFCNFSKAERQEEMKKKHHFVCCCKACKNDWQSVERSPLFEEPTALVQLAILQNDKKLLAEIVPTFIERLRSIESYAPLDIIISLRQLIIDCFQIYEPSRKLKDIKDTQSHLVT